jgi:CHAD domain-containing protein
MPRVNPRSDIENPTSWPPVVRFVDAAYEVFRRQFETMRSNEAGVRAGLDPTPLHDMRVAVRRLRAAFRMFEAAFAPGRLTGFRREFGWLGRRLGDLRDLDVQLANLPGYRKALREADRPLLDGYERYMRARRDEERRSARGALAVLDTARYRRLVTRFEAFLSHGPVQHAPAAAVRPVRTEAARLIRRALSRLRRRVAAVSNPPLAAELHPVRLATKRLRYTCEFFADLGGKRMARFIRRIMRLQDLLGAHQDALVAAAALLQYVDGRKGLPRREVFVLGQLIARMDQRAADLRGEFRDAWRRFDRKAKPKTIRRLIRPQPKGRVACSAAGRRRGAPHGATTNGAKG